MQRLSPRFWSQQFFFMQGMRRNFFTAQIYRDLFGDAMLVPIRMEL